MKKKSQTFKSLKTKEELNTIISTSKDKVIVLNVYDPFWGACEVAEPLIKRFLDDPNTTVKSEWVTCEKSVGSEFIPQQEVFGSKPMFHLFVKGALFSSIDGMNYPYLMQEIKKSSEVFEKTSS